VLGPHRRLATVAQAPRVPRLPDGAIDVAEREWRVDRLDRRRSAVEHEPAARVIELDRIGLTLCAEVGGQVFRSQERGTDTCARAGDRARVHHAERRLADREDLGRHRRNLQNALPMRDRDIERVHLFGACRHRVGDDLGAGGHGRREIDRSIIL